MTGRGPRILAPIVIGAGIGVAVMALQLFFAAGLMFVVLQIAVLAGTYSTSDALGPLATPVFLLLFYAAPAAAIGCVVGALGGGVAGLVRSRART
jgi:hypothetical protein